MNLKPFRSVIWDKIGICASSLCLIHCILTPIILVSFPFIYESWMHETVHITCAIIVMVSVVMAILPHCRKHGHKDIIAFALTGLVFVLTGIFVHENSEVLSIALTIFGSTLLVIAHIKNIKVRHGKCEHSKKTIA